jgi:hypothetical protein
VLRGKDRDTVSLHDVGCPASNPMTFASPHGIAYYFPALARLALAQPGDGYYWYASQLMGNLYSGFRYNSFCIYYNAAQRAAVADLICHIIETRAVLIDNHREADEFLRCHELWNDTTLIRHRKLLIFRHDFELRTSASRPCHFSRIPLRRIPGFHACSFFFCVFVTGSCTTLAILRQLGGTKY